MRETMKKEVFGKTSSGEEVFSYTLSNDNGMEVVLTDFGGTILKILFPDKNGNKLDVVLGCDNMEQYEDNSNFFGSFVGPCANRTANAEATIDGVSYSLEKNDGENNLHTNVPCGMNKRVWQTTCGDNCVTFHTTLKDGEYVFPGNRSFWMTYTLTDKNELKIDYRVESDKNTVLNLTNHSYFNLEGHAGKTIKNHQLQMKASNFTPVVKGAIPTGEIRPVSGTPLDWSKSKGLFDEIESDYEQMQLVNGYDHNYVIDGYGNGVREFARLYAPATGIAMYTATDLPGVQLYTANWVENAVGKEGMVYQQRSGVCLETQHYPDTIHHDNFPSNVFGPERPYESTTIYRFAVE